MYVLVFSDSKTYIAKQKDITNKVVYLKGWLKQNKFYITIAQVIEHKKTNKMVFVWRKSVKDIKNWSLSNIAFLILSFKHRFKHGSGFWPLVIIVTASKCCVNAHCWGTVCTSTPEQLPCLLGVIDQWRVTVIVAVHSLMINPGNKKCTVLINDYILNETLWDFVRQEVLLECLWILRLLFCGLWFHFDIQRCFWAIKLRDIMGKLGDLVSWVHKLCITTE